MVVNKILYYRIVMNTLSRRITGSLAMLVGLVLVIFSIVKTVPVFLVYGIPVLIIGIYIFFNKKEDEIEEINK